MSAAISGSISNCSSAYRLGGSGSRCARSIVLAILLFRKRSSSLEQEQFFGLSGRARYWKLTCGLLGRDDGATKEVLLRPESSLGCSSCERRAGVLMAMLQSVLLISRLFSWVRLRLLLLESTQLLLSPLRPSLPLLGLLPLQRLRMLARKRGMVTPASFIYCSSVPNRFSSAFFTRLRAMNSPIVGLPSKSMSFSTMASSLAMNSSQFLLQLSAAASGKAFERFLLAQTRTSPSLLKQTISDSMSKKPNFSYSFSKPWEAAQMMQSPSSSEMSWISQRRRGTRSKKTEAQWKLLQRPVSLRLWTYLLATRQRQEVRQSSSSRQLRNSASELKTRLYCSTSRARLSLLARTLKLLPQQGSLSLVKQLTGRLSHSYSLKLRPCSACDSVAPILTNNIIPEVGSRLDCSGGERRRE